MWNTELPGLRNVTSSWAGRCRMENEVVSNAVDLTKRERPLTSTCNALYASLRISHQNNKKVTLHIYS
jgi:hypothetical protein